MIVNKIHRDVNQISKRAQRVPGISPHIEVRTRQALKTSRDEDFITRTDHIRQYCIIF